MQVEYYDYENSEVIISRKDLEKAKQNLMDMFNIIFYTWSNLSADHCNNSDCDDVLNRTIYKLVDLAHDIWYENIRYSKIYDKAFYNNILQELEYIEKEVHDYLRDTK